jgi:hypothetical protein
MGMGRRFRKSAVAQVRTEDGRQIFLLLRRQGSRRILNTSVGNFTARVGLSSAAGLGRRSRVSLGGVFFFFFFRLSLPVATLRRGIRQDRRLAPGLDGMEGMDGWIGGRGRQVLEKRKKAYWSGKCIPGFYTYIPLSTSSFFFLMPPARYCTRRREIPFGMPGVSLDYYRFPLPLEYPIVG